jgi:hypothetical protein
VKKLTALLQLALALRRSSGFTLAHERLRDGRAKIRILRAVDRARELIPLRAILRFLRMSRPGHSPSLRSGSVRSGRPPRPGTTWCGSSAGAAPGSACIRPSRRWAFERREPTRCGTSTPPSSVCSTGVAPTCTVIDNFSRRILAWRVADTFAPVNSVPVLVEASRGATSSAMTPVVLADAGVENVNAQIDDLIATGVLRRVLAFTELKFSNSMPI